MNVDVEPDMTFASMISWIEINLTASFVSFSVVGPVLGSYINSDMIEGEQPFPTKSQFFLFKHQFI